MFYSTLTGRFYATQYYTALGVVRMQVTGAKYDVTSDIGHAVNDHDMEFKPEKMAERE